MKRGGGGRQATDPCTRVRALAHGCVTRGTLPCAVLLGRVHGICTGRHHRPVGCRPPDMHPPQHALRPLPAAQAYATVLDAAAAAAAATATALRQCALAASEAQDAR